MGKRASTLFLHLKSCRSATAFSFPGQVDGFTEVIGDIVEFEIIGAIEYSISFNPSRMALRTVMVIMG